MSYTTPPGYRAAIKFVGAYTVPPGYRVAIPFGDPTPIPYAVDDSYSVIYGATLTVAAPGYLSNDTLNSATASLTSSTSNGTLSWVDDGSFVYVPDTGFSGDDSFVYTLTNFSGTSSATVTITVVPLPPVVHYVRSGCGLPWSTAPSVARSIGSGWTTAARARRSNGVAWSAADPVRHSVALPFSRVPAKRTTRGLAWGHAPALAQSAGIPWMHVPKHQIAATLPWGHPPFRQHNAGIAWRGPPKHQIGAGLPWSTPPFRQHSARFAFAHPPKHERRWWLPWGHAKPVQWVVHSPGVYPPPVVPPGHYHPPKGNKIAINFACPQLVFQGNHVPVPFGPAACYFAWPKPRVYVLENSAGVVRLPERTPIPVDAIQLSQSIDDVFWAMQMTLADPSALALLKPDSDGPKAVEITINGYVWTAIVEAWQQDRQHPTVGVSVTGRSQSAVLDAPYAPLRSLVSATDELSEQLIDDELLYTGFTADYSAVAAQTGIGGWTVPAGAWHYDQQTPINAIRTVAAASGAVVQAHPWDVTLIVTPRFPVSPWAWSTATPDKTLADDIILRDSLRLVSKPLYDYVLVSGDQFGYSDPIIRDGAAGDTRATMVVDSLMTDHLATRERGRNVLSDRGEQAQVDVTIPLFTIDVPDTPGLILPLQLVNVVEPTSWKALAVGVSIAAAMQDVNGVAVLTVEQTVTLERHYSDAG